MNAPDLPLRSLPSVDKAARELGDVQGLPAPPSSPSSAASLPRRVRPAPPSTSCSASKPPSTPRQSRLRPVINGTGVIIHTNLGRAPLGPAAAARVADVATHYTNLEYDLATGERGPRAAYLEHALALCCSAEAATVVNNCAAALVLTLRHFAARPPRDHVVISRGELVQIGGGFRVPDILESSGATLREVGTTNKTTLDDYARAIDDRSAMVLKVHRSNFLHGRLRRVPPTEAIAALARERGVPFVEDLGSGANFPTESLGPEHEPTAAEVLAKGVDLVTFSGDKLFAGPQAGIIAGRAHHVAALKRNPLFRALRCDKLTFAALEATVDAHLAGDANVNLPALAMMYANPADLRARAQKILDHLNPPQHPRHPRQRPRPHRRRLPPPNRIDSIALAFTTPDPDTLSTFLRQSTPPVIGYVTEGRFQLDLRTIFPTQDALLVTALISAHRTNS